MSDACVVCGGEIKMMVRRGTHICSENCEKQYNTTIKKETPSATE